MIRYIPPITKNLLFINLIAFLAMMIAGRYEVPLNDILGLHFFMAPNFHVYQLFTYMFMHGGFEHILFNMFALWMFGSTVERAWGGRRFLFFYIFCGIGAGILQEMAQFGSFYMMAVDQIPNFRLQDVAIVAKNSSEALSLWTTVGASGAIYAVMLAFGMTFPEERVFIFPIPFPIKSKWFVVICVGIELISSLSTTNDNVAHLAHLGGMLFGYLLIRYWRKRPYISTHDFTGRDFFENLHQKWGQDRSQHNEQPKKEPADWEYNAREKKKQEEIDRILDKIRRSGYDSLSAEEKRKLFDLNK